ncbi:thiamine-phosphate kinase [Candidatus Micrarchaeota archaeon CG1_02_47_40]|nr:MAG: thiamine-phosphate kinase [Candidatus Micrarchaeota archaeon CG1_02_47_40]QBM01416.1 thiamine-monophosphate kinase [uncultured archaeon]
MNEIEIINTIRKELGISKAPFLDAEYSPFLGTNIIATTDMLNEGDDFPKGMPFEAIGWVSIAANLSDLAAVGAKPLFLLTNWGIPSNLKRQDIASIARGMQKCASFHGVKILGGDINKTEKLAIAGVAIGYAKKPLQRKGAREGDILALTGKVGATAAAYLIYKEGKNSISPAERAFLSRFNKPTIKLALMQKFASLSLASAATDLSDGLSPAIYSICKESGKGARVEYGRIPFFSGINEFASKRKLTPIYLANLGNDYEILLAIKKEKLSLARKTAARLHIPLYEIGKITKENKVLLSKNSPLSPFPKEGFSHFP